MKNRFVCDKEKTVVKTARGKILGYETNGIHVFKGIPYARAARFHAPEPVEPWDDVLDATSFGCVCPLMETPKPNGELFVPHRYWIMDEDCLNLNLWTPGCDDRKRPVLVWLHGGGYSSGSAIEHIAYEGENMARFGDVVMISVNHRLNVLGYFDLSAYGDEYANSANAGGDDIIAALRWVQENAAVFGGDPDNVTVFGQSGGGGKVTTLLQSPAADGTYAKAINMSGVLHHLMGEELIHDPAAHAEALMKELSVHSVKELETIPYASLAAAYGKVFAAFNAQGRYAGNQPWPNAFYKGDPVRVGFRRETADIPMLVGAVFGELTAFAEPEHDRRRLSEEEQHRILSKLLGTGTTDRLTELFRAAYPGRPAIDLLRMDFMFRPGIIEYVRERSRVNPHTYSYLFTHDMPIYGGQTAWHCADIPYVFHNTEFVPSTQEPGVTDYLQEKIFASVIAFARTGDPDNSLIPHWPSSTPEKEHVMLFDTQNRVLTNFDHALVGELSAVMLPLFNHRKEENMAKVQH